MRQYKKTKFLNEQLDIIMNKMMKKENKKHDNSFTFRGKNKRAKRMRRNQLKAHSRLEITKGVHK